MAGGPGDLLVEAAPDPPRAGRVAEHLLGAVRAQHRSRVVALDGAAVVRRDERGPGEERPGGRGLLPEALAGQPAEQAGLVGALVRHQPTVVVERGVEVAVGAPVELRALLDPAVDRALPVAPAGWHVAQRGPSARRPLDAVPVEVLAEERRVVAGAVEPHRERPPVPEGREAVRRGVRPDVVVVGVLTGEERRAGRTAQRLRGERVGEPHALVADQPPHVRHEPQVVVAGVVGHHHDHVGPVAAPHQRPHREGAAPFGSADQRRVGLLWRADGARSPVHRGVRRHLGAPGHEAGHQDERQQRQRRHQPTRA